MPVNIGAPKISMGPRQRIRIELERSRINRFRTAEIISPTAGILWEILNASGVNVQRGDLIARVVDCQSVIVTASVTENIFNSLTVGSPVIFRPRGEARTFEGRIIRLAGPGAATVYEHLAVAPSERHLQRYDVAVSVPDLSAEPNLACAMGKTGRIFFDRRPLDWARTLWK